jgi:hypothetical protein
MVDAKRMVEINGRTIVKNECVTMKKGKKQDENKEGEMGNKSMTDQEIKTLAEDMYKGLIFTNMHIERQEDISMVFVPLVLAGKGLVEELAKNPPGMIYEYMDKAGPMAVNGMPIFFSFKIASIDDTKKVFEHYHKIKEAVTNA